MGKKVNLILIKNQFKEERKGTIISVARGYAFNYLIPNKIAEVTTPNKIKHFKMFTEIKKQLEENERQLNIQLKKKIEKINNISVYKKAGDKNLIFGSITEKDIVHWIVKHTDFTIKKKNIKVNIIKTSGKYNIDVEITNNIKHTITLYVVPTDI
uniref:Large ribosomal subunit protein bL9c n=1 Tax=Digenea simplex TaxID=945030 RepID=A0A1Z1MU32_DIGSM|nr:ribosomal protein L9 [Digenea simplex]ARW69617.1 ribosomal protein L9 [Digenea simplex]